MSHSPIPFNKPFLTGKETHFIYDAVNNKGQLSGNGYYTKKCQDFFKEKYLFKHCLLTSSCTDALEMASILIDTQAGDEIIIPSYTFVSSANAFVLRGAKIIFADSGDKHPNITLSEIKRLTSNKTKAVVVVHYAGQGSEIDLIAEYCKENNIFLIEDAAQSIDTYYKDKPLGSFGDLSTFSFHETKNIISGEGGLLVVNNEEMIERSEIIWEKGTNRSKFFRGEIDKYGWVDIGSSFLPSEVTAAFLWAQLSGMKEILSKRELLWNRYFNNLSKSSSTSSKLQLPIIPDFSTNNHHIFYIRCANSEERSELIKCLKNIDIKAVFHYLPLHLSPFHLSSNEEVSLPNSVLFANSLLRLPMYNELSFKDVDLITNTIIEFYS